MPMPVPFVKDIEFEYGKVQQVTPLIRRIIAHNPGPFTYTGTGVYIIGEGSGEMINEWSLAIQKRLRITDIMMLQHSFPTMGFLTKRVSETWMMNTMKSERLRKLCRFMFRIGH